MKGDTIDLPLSLEGVPKQILPIIEQPVEEEKYESVSSENDSIESLEEENQQNVSANSFSRRQSKTNNSLQLTFD